MEHFTAVQDLLFDLAKRAGAADPKALADRLALIIDGANTNGAALGGQGSALAAIAFAEDVVRAAFDPSTHDPLRTAGRDPH